LNPWLGQLIRKWYDDRATVITFNYDTLVEKAYTEVLRQVVDTDHIDLYAIPVTDIRTRTRLYGRRITPTMRYLKLHGSVNWCYSGAASFFGETIYDLYIEPGWGAASAELEDDLEQKAPEKVHLVVPPTTSKSALFNNEIVRSQWRIARTALEDATVIYCLGYSLPETDQMVRYLLSTLPGSKLVVPVDIKKNVATRYARLLKPHRVVSDYVGIKDPIPAFVSDWLAGAVSVTSPVETRGSNIPKRL
jgi:hypothetical protein